MKTTFRIISFLEGISYVLLLFIGVPFKYGFNDPSYVKLLGMPHGLLFVGYIVVGYLISSEMNWSSKDKRFVMLASIIPFGTFVVERVYFSSSKKNTK